MGRPYTRGGPCLFIHGPDVLIDTPADIGQQLNTSSVERIAACFYSHWHPDHTMGRHVFSTINADYRAWPPAPRGTIDVYLPEQVAADARKFLSLWEHLRFLEEQERVIRVHELRDGDSVQVGETSIRPLRLAQEYAYGFLCEEARRLLVVPDEIDGWEPPPEAQGVDLAVLPMGVVELDPLSGERRIAPQHPVLAAEATFAETLEIARALDAKRIVMTHIEESDGLGHDDLLEIADRVRRSGIELSFAYDTMAVEV
jgi:phosphoribosyl 1,2-cyclic phosphate phosphodiesterase